MGYIRGFDGLRCFSILLVVITHLGVAGHFPEESYWRSNFFYFFSGAAGVNIFFAISGFLITTLLLHERKKNGRIDFLKFFARRFLRLLPPILPFYIALFVFMQLGYVRETYIGLAASLLYLFNFVPRAKVVWSSELSHTWSLSVEEQFYILWAIVFKFLNKNFMYFTGMLLIAACAIFSFAIPVLSVDFKGTEYALTEVFFPYRWTIPAIGAIVIGAVVALVNFDNRFNVKARFKKAQYGLLALLIFCSPLYLPSFLLPVIRLFHGLGAALVLLWVFHNQEHRLVKILEWRPVKYIGMISYGIYIWQGFFIRTGPEALPKVWLHDFPYNVILAFLVSILSYELFEKRVMKLKKKYSIFIPKPQ